MADHPEGLEGVTTLQAVADRVSQGAALHAEDIAAILEATDLIAIGMMADEVRRGRHGAQTTFVRVFEVHADAVPEALPPAVVAGEFRVIGRPESLDGACAAVSAVRGLAGSTPVTGFSLDYLAALAGSDSPYVRLKEAGLDGVADLPLDLVPEPAAAVGAARAAGLLVQRITVHAVPPDPVALLRQALDLQDATGAFRALAPLSRSAPPAAPTTGYDDVKLVALARLLVRNIPSIQVDWPLYGPKLAQVALTVGADDVDGVAAADAGALGPRRSAIEEIRGNIRAAGLEPVERNGRYERTA